jgi:hypothetical protein
MYRSDRLATSLSGIDPTLGTAYYLIAVSASIGVLDPGCSDGDDDPDDRRWHEYSFAITEGFHSNGQDSSRFPTCDQSVDELRSLGGLVARVAIAAVKGNVEDTRAFLRAIESVRVEALAGSFDSVKQELTGLISNRTV